MEQQPAEQQSAEQRSRREAMTAQLCFTEMLLALRALERVATGLFMNDRDNSNRTDNMKSVVKQVRLIQTTMPGYVAHHCHPPMCDAGDGTCEPCDFTQLREELTAALEAV
jgi:hypothetical protein